MNAINQTKDDSGFSQNLEMLLRDSPQDLTGIFCLILPPPTSSKKTLYCLLLALAGCIALTYCLHNEKFGLSKESGIFIVLALIGTFGGCGVFCAICGWFLMRLRESLSMEQGTFKGCGLLLSDRGIGVVGNLCGSFVEKNVAHRKDNCSILSVKGNVGSVLRDLEEALIVIGVTRDREAGATMSGLFVSEINVVSEGSVKFSVECAPTLQNDVFWGRSGVMRRAMQRYGRRSHQLEIKEFLLGLEVAIQRLTVPQPKVAVVFQEAESAKKLSKNLLDGAMGGVLGLMIGGAVRGAVDKRKIKRMKEMLESGVIYNQEITRELMPIIKRNNWIFQ